MKKVKMVPITVGSVRTVLEGIRRNINVTRIEYPVEHLQKLCLFDKARIIKKVLDT